MPQGCLYGCFRAYTIRPYISKRLKISTHRTGQHYGKNRATLPHGMTNANGSVLEGYADRKFLFMKWESTGVLMLLTIEFRSGSVTAGKLFVEIRAAGDADAFYYFLDSKIGF